MKTLKESLFDTDLTKKIPITVDLKQYQHPKTRTALVEAIAATVEYYIKYNLISKRDDIIDLNWIDVSNVVDMSNLFSTTVVLFLGRYTILSDFNYDVSKWDIKNVKFMQMMFKNCYSFNCDISKWDVSNVKNMAFMFYNCGSFDQDLSEWNIKKTINTQKKLNNMFHGCDKMKPEHLPSIA